MNTEVFLNSILVGGGATLTATQILKSKYIPIAFQKYPRATAAAISLIAAIVSEYNSNLSIDSHNLPQLLGLFIGTLWVAISTYNHLNLKNISINQQGVN